MHQLKVQLPNVFMEFQTHLQQIYLHSQVNVEECIYFICLSELKTFSRRLGCLSEKIDLENVKNLKKFVEQGCNEFWDLKKEVIERKKCIKKFFS